MSDQPDYGSQFYKVESVNWDRIIEAATKQARERGIPALMHLHKADEECADECFVILPDSEPSEDSDA